MSCGTCRHFVRDTEGPSFNAYTRIYFMGECKIGSDPDRTFNKQRGTAKIFADKLRQCEKHEAGGT
ncbi:MAG: hypothetical protein J5799_04610 [Bacteroidales bacterium]|nr:hypothetical protein [Bacteroidales bacterium]MBR5920044.1 hypothetical protein [Bacteroidales bacterium]